MIVEANVRFEWRGPCTNIELNRLHSDGFGNGAGDADWATRLEHHSLGWVCARLGEELVGFVNLAWDGGVHGFILDTVIAESVRRRGIGTELVAICAHEARARGCEWLHVDFEEHLQGFYVDSCGFTISTAGVMRL